MSNDEIIRLKAIIQELLQGMIEGNVPEMASPRLKVACNAARAALQPAQG
jgi:hypothetical protein